MVRDDMFRWIEQKRLDAAAERSAVTPEPTAVEPETVPLEPEPLQPEPVAVASEQVAAAPEPVVAETEQEAAPSIPLAEPEPEPDTASPEPENPENETPLALSEHQRILKALTTVRKEPKPCAGMAAMELAPPRFRRAYVISVKADGRRLTARIRDVDRIYCYTLRRDGTYRLEGVPLKSAPRLLLDIDV